MINADNILVEKVRKRTSVQVLRIELCSYVSYADIVTFHLNRLVGCFHGFEGSKPRVFFCSFSASKLYLWLFIVIY